MLYSLTFDRDQVFGLSLIKWAVNKVQRNSCICQRLQKRVEAGKYLNANFVSDREEIEVIL